MFPETKSGKLNQANIKAENRIFGRMLARANPKQFEGSQGSASRFFKQFHIKEEDIRSFVYCAKASKKDREEGLEGASSRSHISTSLGIGNHLRRCPVHGDSIPSGSRTYACGCEYVFEKADSLMMPRKNIHPTVKPTDLMVYLCRLVTPHGGVVLDPFMGSGSTGKAALREGFSFVGIELDPEYFKIAKMRIDHVGGEVDRVTSKRSARERLSVLRGKKVADGKQMDLLEYIDKRVNNE
jgi:site-specific DNA-methyltransferase (adenine-specific)